MLRKMWTVISGRPVSGKDKVAFEILELCGKAISCPHGWLGGFCRVLKLVLDLKSHKKCKFKLTLRNSAVQYIEVIRSAQWLA
eukprot:s3831_g16.t1